MAAKKTPKEPAKRSATKAAAKKADKPKDQAERLLNLLALLTHDSNYRTLEEIHFATNMYGDRSLFERDKAILRDMGVPIDSKVLGGSKAGVSSYRIDRREMELANINFTEAERRALQLALAAVHVDSAWAERARMKLDLTEAQMPSVAQVNLPVNSELLPTLADAAAKTVCVRFDYVGGTHRSLNAYGLLSRGGYWYVVGYDLDRKAIRSFRVDRIVGGVELTSDKFERPADFDVEAAVATDVEMLGDAGGSIAHVLVSEKLRPSIVRDFGEGCVVETRDDAVVVAVPCANRSAFRSWVLGLVAGAEVLSPPEVRQDLIDWLDTMVGTR
ncbi:MAG: WYL domain-containing protein [Actinobacteria bacterium]|nr:WYL domain-containing protein [Actinomycetota bacterium]